MKRFAKLLISLLVWLYDQVCGALARLARRPRPARCVVLYYHAVNPGQRSAFARQMDWLARHYRVIPLAGDQQAPTTDHRPLVSLTFDDGFVSVLENALPELERRQLPAAWFLPTGCLGQPPAWIKDPAAPAACQTVMTREQVSSFKFHPLISIGSHTVTHPRLTQLSDAEAERELSESKATLESLLGQEVPLLSFPHGDHNPRILEQARRAGYRRVFTVQPRCAGVEDGDWVIGRVAVEPDDWPLEFRLKASGAYRWLAWIKTASNSSSLPSCRAVGPAKADGEREG